jgi:hypothetical protein
VAGWVVRSVTVRPILADEVGRFNAELDAHHLLGHRLTGQVLRYVAVLDGEWVALSGSGPLRCRAQPGTASSGGAGRRSTRGCAMS